MKGRRSCVSWYHYQDFLEAFPPRRSSPTPVSGDARASPAPAGRGLRHSATLPDRAASGAGGRAEKPARCCCSTGRAPAAMPNRTHPWSETVTEPRVRRALLLMEQNLARPSRSLRWHPSLACRAPARAPVPPARRHGSGLALRQLRMRYANWLIENTDRSVTDIAKRPVSRTARTSRASSRTPTVCRPRRGACSAARRQRRCRAGTGFRVAAWRARGAAVVHFISKGIKQ